MEKRAKRLHRWYTITQVLFILSPLICYAYLSIKLSEVQYSLQELLQLDPTIAITFLIAMINPFIAYQIRLIKKRLENGDTSYVYINMMLLVLSQILLSNYFYLALLIVVFYKTMKVYDISLRDGFISSKRLSNIKHVVGSVSIILLSSLCFYASMQVM